MGHTGTLLGGAALTALLLALGHWFNWPAPLPLLGRYVYGSAAVWAGFALWRGLNGDWQTPVGLAVVYIIAGATVGGAYGWDHVMLRMRQAERYAASDQDIIE